MNLSKECNTLILAEAWEYSQYEHAVSSFMDGMTKALTTPSIYNAARLTKATPLTDEELEKEAEKLFKSFEIVMNELLPDDDNAGDKEFKMYSIVKELKELAASKMGSSGWVSVDKYNLLLEALKGIEALCDNQNDTHESIWRIANAAINNSK
jgi:hypothetical protein